MAAVESKGTDRLAWLDLARAISIILVVLYHAGTGGVVVALVGEGTAATLWRSFNISLIPLRMPLFFLISGALAVGAIHRGFRKVARPRVLDILWPYVLWSLIWAVTAMPRYAPDDPAGYLLGHLRAILVVGSPYWFLAALTIFFLLMRLGREHPRVMLAVAFVAYAAAPFLDAALKTAGAPSDLTYGIFQITDNAVWYVLGYGFSTEIRSTRRRVRVGPGLVLGAVFCVLAAVIVAFETPLAVTRLLEFVASITGLAACAVLLPLVARWAPLARAGSYLGSRTLTIYVVHPVVINFVIIGWVFNDVGDMVSAPVRALLVVPVVTALAVGVALLLDFVVNRWGPGWLLKCPGGGTPTDRVESRMSGRSRQI